MLYMKKKKSAAVEFFFILKITFHTTHWSQKQHTVSQGVISSHLRRALTMPSE